MTLVRWSGKCLYSI